MDTAGPLVLSATYKFGSIYQVVKVAVYIVPRNKAILDSTYARGRGQ